MVIFFIHPDFPIKNDIVKNGMENPVDKPRVTKAPNIGPMQGVQPAAMD